MVDFVKAALVPGSTAFLLLGLIVGVLLLYWRNRTVQWARRGLTSLAVLYVVLSFSPVSSALVAGLQGRYSSITEIRDAHGARTVVVIGNGATSYSAGGQAVHQLTRRTAFAVLEAERLYRLLNPAWIVAAGGIPDRSSQQRPESEIMRDELVKLGVPADRIVLESSSRTTAEQIANVARMVNDAGLEGPVVVVTTPGHARRVMMTAERHGLNAVLSITDALTYGQGAVGWRRWRPNADALRGSESAMYEYLATAYYRLARPPASKATS